MADTMTLKEVTEQLGRDGLDYESHTVRRRIDTYLYYPSRNDYNNYRSLTKLEYIRLRLALAIESRGFSQDEVLEFLKGKRPKLELITTLKQTSKVDMILQEWMED